MRCTLKSTYPTTHELPQHLVKIREGNDETVRYFHQSEDLAKFGMENPDLDLGLSGEGESDTSLIEKARNGNGATRRARHEELYESHAIKGLLEELARKGLSIESTTRRRTSRCLDWSKAKGRSSRPSRFSRSRKFSRASKRWAGGVYR